MNQPTQTPQIVLPAVPVEVQAISMIINPIAEAMTKNADCNLQVERERNETERARIASANRTHIGVFGIAVFLLTLAAIALFKDKDVLVQTLSSLVVGMLAGFGIGYGVKK